MSRSVFSRAIWCASLCVAIFSFFSGSVQTDGPRIIGIYNMSEEDFHSQRDFFIEDEYGNVFYVSRSKTEEIERPNGSLVYKGTTEPVTIFSAEESIDGAKSDGLTANGDSDACVNSGSFGGIEYQEEGYCEALEGEFKRGLSRDIRRIFNQKRACSAWNSEPHDFDEIPPYIGPKNSYRPGCEKFIQKFSMHQTIDGVTSVRTDYENLIKTFYREVVCKHVKIKKHPRLRPNWSSIESSLKTLSNLEKMLDTHKKLKRGPLRRLENVNGKNYINVYINTYKTDLQRELEGRENKRIGMDRAAKERVVQEKLEELLAKSPDNSTKSTKSSNASEDSEPAQEKQWLEAELHLQQQDGTVFLDKKERKFLANLKGRFTNDKRFEASKVYLKMLNQAERELYQNNFRMSKKLYNRLMAVHVAVGNNFGRQKSCYSLNKFAHNLVPDGICDLDALKSCSGNRIQHNVHGEIVGLVNRYSYYLHANNKNHASDGPNLYEASDIALGMKEKLDGKEETAKTKIYERTYSFLDFCHNLLKVKVGQTALNLWMRFGKGLELGGQDVQNACRNCLKGSFSGGDFDHDNVLSDILDGKESLENILEKERVSFAKKRQRLGDAVCNLFQRARTQPLMDSFGDTIQFLSRKLVQTSAIMATALGVVIAVETGAAAIVGMSTAFVAKNLEASLSNIGADGSACATVISAGTKVWDAVGVVAGQAVQGLSSVVESAKVLLCASQGPGGGVDDSRDLWIVSDGREVWFEKGKIGKQMRKRGWTKEDIDGVLIGHKRRFKTTVERWQRIDGKDVRVKEGEATVFFKANNEYVVVSNDTGEIIQLSDKFNAGWKPSWDLWTEL